MLIVNMVSAPRPEVLAQQLDDLWAKSGGPLFCANSFSESDKYTGFEFRGVHEYEKGRVSPVLVFSDDSQLAVIWSDFESGAWTKGKVGMPAWFAPRISMTIVRLNEAGYPYSFKQYRKLNFVSLAAE